MKKVVIGLAVLILIMSVTIMLLMPEENKAENACLKAIKSSYEISQAILSEDEARCEGEPSCIASIRNNASICDEFNGSFKKSCLSRIHKDPSICEGEEDCIPFMTKKLYKETEERCRIFGIISKAMAENDPTICDETGEYKDKCIEAIEKNSISIEEL